MPVLSRPPLEPVPPPLPGFVPRQRVVADRYLGFAFAAAELLVETDLTGHIGFATGTFLSRFGVPAESFIGAPIAQLFRSADEDALARAVDSVKQIGRIVPVVLHLADAGASAMSVSAMLMPEDGAGPARLCFTIGAIAVVPDRGLTEPAPPRVQGPKEFARMAEERLRSGREAKINLLEFKGLAGMQSPEVLAEVQKSLERAIAGGQRRAGLLGAGTVMAGQLGDGRFGLLAAPEVDVSATLAHAVDLLRDTQAGRNATLVETSMALTPGDLTPLQAARALRHALGCFISGGTEATIAAGGDQGLAGIIAGANARAVNLRDTIRARRFRLKFQPVVSLQDRRIHHFEALLRPIPTPPNPAQPTQDFVAFAEAVGLSDELDWAVLQSTIDTLIARRNVSVAVNLSGFSIQNPEFRDRMLEEVQALASRPERPCARLLVELTETAEITDIKGAAKTIEALRAAGVPVCLDDFGAGSAALRYLRAFQVDFVKIDGVYVHGAETNTRDRSFVASIVELADTVGAQVVAEMIETESQAELMRNMGAQFGQGWLFGRPGTLPGGR